MTKLLEGYAPWVGHQYTDGFDGLRLLIVGDSHYECDEEEVFDKETWTTTCVKYWVVEQCEPTPVFWKKLTGVVQTALAPERTQPDIWEHLAYGNFIPRPMKYAREAPKTSDFKDGEKCFQSMLDSLPALPDIILVASVRCFEWMPYDKEAGYRILESDPRGDRAYRLGNAWMGVIRHPSSSWWHRVPNKDAISTWGAVLKELSAFAKT